MTERHRSGAKDVRAAHRPEGLRTAIESLPSLEHFVAPRLPIKYVKPIIVVDSIASPKKQDEVVAELDDEEPEEPAPPAASSPSKAEGETKTVAWKVSHDTELLLGTYKHGHSNWAGILSDESLPRLHALSLRGDSSTTASGSADGAPTPPPDGDAWTWRKSDTVTARDLSRRLKNLLNNVPWPLPPDPKREAAVGGAKAEMEEEAAEVAEVFILSLYPAGIDRNKPAEPMTLDGGVGFGGGGGGGGGERFSYGGGANKKEMTEAEKAAREEAAALAKEVKNLGGKAAKSERAMQVRRQLEEARERAKAAAQAAKEAREREKEREKQAAREAKERERQQKEQAKQREKAAKEEERNNETVKKWLEDFVMRVAKHCVKEEWREEKAKEEAARLEARAEKEAERAKVHAEKAAVEEARRQERDAERARKEEEKAYAERMRHMLKVRALDNQRVVHLNLSTSPPSGGEPAQVHVGFSFPSNVTSVSRLADGITRLMNEYDWSNKSEVFKKGHRWMQLLDSVELGLQRNIGERYAVRSSMGCGGWAKVPWLAVSDPSESTQHGLYLQYLFRADMSAVYLCLGQGTSLLKKAFGPAAASRHLQHVGEYVRAKARRLVGDASGIDLNGDIHLRSGATGLGRDYEQGCVIARIYEHGVPLQEAVLLEQVSVKQQHTRTHTPNFPTSPLFSHAPRTLPTPATTARRDDWNLRVHPLRPKIHVRHQGANGPGAP